MKPLSVVLLVAACAAAGWGGYHLAAPDVEPPRFVRNPVIDAECKRILDAAEKGDKTEAVAVYGVHADSAIGVCRTKAELDALPGGQD